jgi:hypothetical protein
VEGTCLENAGKVVDVPDLLLDWRVELPFLQIRESSDSGEFDLRLPSNTKPGNIPISLVACVFVSGSGKRAWLLTCAITRIKNKWSGVLDNPRLAEAAGLSRGAKSRNCVLVPWEREEQTAH